MSITGNIDRIEERILNACTRSGRKRDEIILMGVSKFHPVEAIEQAWIAGLRFFGESRVQEAAAKFSGFREGHSGLQLHMVGFLQRNKAKAAVSLFDCIQSVDREELAGELAKHAAGQSTAENPLQVLLELHTGEDSKSGIAGIDELLRIYEAILAFPALNVGGLMTMAPDTADEKLIRLAFRKLAAAQRELKQRFGETASPVLSMGMSGDFEIAVEEGSTLLRIGSAIFGERIC